MKLLNKNKFWSYSKFLGIAHQKAKVFDKIYFSTLCMYVALPRYLPYLIIYVVMGLQLVFKQHKNSAMFIV